jgi:hypothetical protein
MALHPIRMAEKQPAVIFDAKISLDVGLRRGETRVIFLSVKLNQE